MDTLPLPGSPTGMDPSFHNGMPKSGKECGGKAHLGIRVAYVSLSATILMTMGKCEKRV